MKHPEGVVALLPDESAPGAGVRAAERAIEVLFAVAEAEVPMTLSDIARGTQLDKATAFRMINSLVKTGALARVSDRGEYRMGHRMLQLLLSHSKYDALKAVAKSIMVELNRLSGETVGLIVLEWPDRHCIAQVESRWGLRRTHHPGERFPITVGATGVVMLSRMPRAKVEEALALYPPRRLTVETVVDTAAFLALVDEARECGYSTSFSQIIEGMSTVASPVLGPDGRLLAAINVSGPTARWDRDQVMAFAPRLVDATMRISRQLGYTVGH